MRKKLELLSTVAMLAATVVCIAVNFKAASSETTIEAVNITATVFYLLFWALMTRLEPASKISALIALYTLAAGIVGVCAAVGGWANLFTSIFTAPAIMMFYGIKFFSNINLLCGVMAVISFVILIYSLITLANRKPEPKRAAKAETEEEVPQIAESIDISETELVSAAAEYVEMINTFENKEIETDDNAEQTEVTEENVQA